MFTVIKKGSGEKYKVFAVKEENGRLYFLIYDSINKWNWEQAKLFYPNNPR